MRDYEREFSLRTEYIRDLLKNSGAAGLFDSQTDEEEMGISYAAIDRYLLRGTGSAKVKAKIEERHARNLHKLQPISTFENP